MNIDDDGVDSAAEAARPRPRAPVGWVCFLHRKIFALSDVNIRCLFLKICNSRSKRTKPAIIVRFFSIYLMSLLSLLIVG